ncbi:D-alanine--D-alanine ligase family protein [Papillibacter cinnamivorans]|uniref:D-alanine--D-alanine ligase n=1 Tax=Papillibacter cinnamivorans DSM 12816 TaxID=1122930 RepID=A0A1W1YJ06_9FIRM|nr:D-alanine--D-alanine ligase [Papillibacter cinnamivorans]SMC36149.1 D-alanine-D-alanine ligase [Papillibacter cinnamivorans DSM 12816]
MNIVVLAGGLSPERNVSLSTGSLVCKTLRGAGHKAVLVDLFLGLENWSGDPSRIFDAEDGLCMDYAVSETEPDLEAVKASRKSGELGIFGKDVIRVCSMADIVFLALHGGCGEDGRLQAAFDLIGIPYTGSGYLGSAIAMDKDLTKRIVQYKGVLTPRWYTLDYEEQDIPAIVERTALPCVVKVVGGGSSIGVALPKTPEELEAALRDFLKFGGRIIVEQYIRGREFSVGVLEETALQPIEIIPKEGFYDYKNKYQPGLTTEICPADIPDQIRARLMSAALAVHRAIQLNVYSRSDFILDEGGDPYFLEVNTLPGMTPTSLIPQMARVAGYSYEELCRRIIKASAKIRGK